MLVKPTTYRVAKAFVTEHHRHSKAPQGWIVGVALHDDETDVMVGVGILGRPVARLLQDGSTAEITRVCVLPDTPNGCSQLYGALVRAAFALGYTRVVTYTLATEPGSSLKASGFVPAARVDKRQWDRPKRPRTDGDAQERVRWERYKTGRS